MRKNYCLICGEPFYQKEEGMTELGCGNCGQTLKEKIDSRFRGVSDAKLG